MEHGNALPAGMRLGEYEIESVLGSGGFGITYRAYDTHLNLNTVVAIKEYLPRDFAMRTTTRTVVPTSQADRADYEWGLKKFLEEAYTLARFKHPHINEVKRYFEAHGTAYLVLEYIEGEPLSVLLRQHQTLRQGQVKRLLADVLSGLAEVHAANYVHRDLKPGNLMVRRDGSTVVVDFGAARQAVGQRSKSITSILTPGYAPIEQYGTKAEDVGPWNDIYAMGMVAYRCISGLGDGDLPDAVTRSRAARKGSGDLEPAASIGRGRYDARLLDAIDWAIQVEEEDRPQSIDAWRIALPPLDDRELPRSPQPSVFEPEQSEPGPEGSRSQFPHWVTIAGIMTLIVAMVGGAYWLGQHTSEVPTGQVATPTPSPSDQRQDLSLTPQVSPSVPEPRKPVVAVPQVYPFVVETEPIGAEVELLGIEESYRAGLELPVGQYQVEVRAEGYEPQRVWVEHTESGEPHRVALAAVRQPFTIVAEPAEARIRIMNIPERYQAGMALPAGDYEVEVSAEGYTTVTETVIHGVEPTARRIVLAPTETATGPESSGAEPTEPPVASAPPAPQHDTLRLWEAEGRRQQAAVMPTPFRDCPICPMMVEVPAGWFLMGSPASEEGRDGDEGPQHRVTIAGRLAVGVYEVTFEEWDACVSGGGCNEYRPYDREWGRRQRPVIHVSWEDARAYVRWLSEQTRESYRLLSEAEWEYVARAGTTTPFYFGRTIATSQANYNGNYTYGSGRRGRYRGQTVPVGSFAPNAFGLYDTHGNVWEWVEDCWNGSYRNAPADGSARNSGDCSRCVRRGGSWIDLPSALRSGFRNGFTSVVRVDVNGFRVARTFR